MAATLKNLGYVPNRVRHFYQIDCIPIAWSSTVTMGNITPSSLKKLSLILTRNLHHMVIHTATNASTSIWCSTIMCIDIESDCSGMTKILTTFDDAPSFRLIFHFQAFGSVYCATLLPG